MLLVLNWSKPALDVNKVKYIDNHLCGKIPLKTWLQNVKTDIKETKHGHQPVKCM